MAENPQARDAADQLVDLMRLALHLEDSGYLEDSISGGGRRRNDESRGKSGESRTLRHNRVVLSGRELDAFRLLVRGGYNPLLAQSMGLSEEFLDAHVQSIVCRFEAPARGSGQRARRGSEREAADRGSADAQPWASRSGDAGAGGARPGDARSGGERRRRRAVTVLASAIATAAVVIVTFTAEDQGESEGPAGAGLPAGASPHPLVSFGVSADRNGRGQVPPSAWAAREQLLKRTALPEGTATATSFWDGGTARGRPMSYRTIASPYWPLGTSVRIRYRDRTAVGVVEDFGPADWAITQHDIPAIIDLSEAMMANLTKKRVNAIRIRFEVLEWGMGGTYRNSGPGYELAMGKKH